MTAFEVSATLAVARILPMSAFLIGYRGRLLGPWQIFLRGLAGVTIMDGVATILLVQHPAIRAIDVTVISPWLLWASQGARALAALGSWWLLGLFWWTTRRRP